MRADTNKRVEVKELRHVAATDLPGALREMEAVATACPRCQKPFYHASINTREDERLTDDQRIYAIDRLETELGLTGQPRVVVVHEKEGREHCHIVWSRIDIENERTISDSHNFRKHEKVARELEREFGHARVQGAHVERDGQPRPARTPGHDEMQQAGRTGLSPKEAKAQLTALWQRTDSGQAFAAALDENGWVLARGDRRDFVAVDRYAEAHSLARRIEGARAKDIRERLADLQGRELPSVAEAKQEQLARQAERQSAETARAAPAPEPPRPPPRQPEPERFTPEPPPPERAMPDFAPEANQTAGIARDAAATVDRGITVGGEIAGQASEKLVDFVSSITDSFTGSPPPRQYSPAELAQSSAARRDHYAQQSAERASDEALDRIRLDMESGKSLRPDDVRSLTHAHLLQIRAHGDDYLRNVINDLEKEQSRSSGIERERER